MISEYCIYKNMVYEVEMKNENLRLFSHDVNDKITNGFNEYVDVLGRLFTGAWFFKFKRLRNEHKLLLRPARQILGS
ncbi:hypothetical protein [Neobacillus niacini]|uniref:hypothetical protein n=1 Tax=Neobacillus niacini TaxID=86668 RepID=UPI002863160E|nr:hypothetical protein [Neobacillus niacini]MDR6999142.1 hypothetical protein [Neobacillus niacini]